MSRTKTPLTTSRKHCQISKSSPCTFYRNNIAINPVNISIHYHQLLNYAPHLQTTFISKLNKGKTNYGIGVITYTIVNNLHTLTQKKKKKLLQDQNFNYRINKEFILKLTNAAASCLQSKERSFMFLHVKLQQKSNCYLIRKKHLK